MTAYGGVSNNWTQFVKDNRRDKATGGVVPLDELALKYRANYGLKPSTLKRDKHGKVGAKRKRKGGAMKKRMPMRRGRGSDGMYEGEGMYEGGFLGSLAAAVLPHVIGPVVQRIFGSGGARVGGVRVGGARVGGYGTKLGAMRAVATKRRLGELHSEAVKAVRTKMMRHEKLGRARVGGYGTRLGALRGIATRIRRGEHLGRGGDMDMDMY